VSTVNFEARPSHVGTEVGGGAESGGLCGIHSAGYGFVDG